MPAKKPNMAEVRRRMAGKVQADIDARDEADMLAVQKMPLVDLPGRRVRSRVVDKMSEMAYTDAAKRFGYDEREDGYEHVQPPEQVGTMKTYKKWPAPSKGKPLTKEDGDARRNRLKKLYGAK